MDEIDRRVEKGKTAEKKNEKQRNESKNILSANLVFSHLTFFYCLHDSPGNQNYSKTSNDKGDIMWSWQQQVWSFADNRK